MYLDRTGHSWEGFWNGVGNFFSNNWDIIIGTVATIGFAIAGIALSIVTFGVGAVLIGIAAGALIGGGLGALGALSRGDDVLYGFLSGDFVGALGGIGGGFGALAAGFGASTASLLGDVINGRKKDHFSAAISGITAFIASLISSEGARYVLESSDTLVTQFLVNGLSSFIF